MDRLGPASAASMPCVSHSHLAPGAHERIGDQDRRRLVVRMMIEPIRSHPLEGVRRPERGQSPRQYRRGRAIGQVRIARRENPEAEFARLGLTVREQKGALTNQRSIPREEKKDRVDVRTNGTWGLGVETPAEPAAGAKLRRVKSQERHRDPIPIRPRGLPTESRS